jgi:hypothetical protein
MSIVVGLLSVFLFFLFIPYFNRLIDRREEKKTYSPIRIECSLPQLEMKSTIAALCDLHNDIDSEGETGLAVVASGARGYQGASVSSEQHYDIKELDKDTMAVSYGRVLADIFDSPKCSDPDYWWWARIVFPPDSGLDSGRPFPMDVQLIGSFRSLRGLISRESYRKFVKCIRRVAQDAYDSSGDAAT